MDLNNGKSLSPWKVPSRISLKRIRHKINSDFSLPNQSSSIDETNSLKRTRSLINKFALSRSISTPTSNENIQQQTNNDEDILERIHQLLPLSSQNFNEISQSSKKGRVVITDKSCPLEKIHFFYVKRSSGVNSSRIALVGAVVNYCHFYTKSASS